MAGVGQVGRPGDPPQPALHGLQVWNNSAGRGPGRRRGRRAGHQTVMRWNGERVGVVSRAAHEAIIDAKAFAKAEEQRLAGRNRPANRKPRSSPRPYALKGLLLCGICGRRMSGQQNHGRTHYRCRFPSEYALANKVNHPPTVYLREDVVLPHLDEWISHLFDPEAIEDTCRQLADGQAPAVEDVAAVEAAHRNLADCDGHLVKHRAALEAGADPTIVAAWIAEVQGERTQSGRWQPLSRQEEPSHRPTSERSLTVWAVT